MNRHSRITNLYARSSLLLAITAASAHAAAQQTIEEIIVTADFRRGGINTLPTSISVVDSSVMQRRNALHLEDVLLNTPNVNVASVASRARYFQIRGIGETGQFTEPLNASVGLLIDGVDFSGIGGAALLYDMEQVEVLLGPQGTRYGSNALAGLINLQSRAPSESLSYGLQLQGENYAGRGLAGYVSGAASPTLLYRLSAQTLDSDGASTNLYLGRPTNTRDERTLRGKLRWLATDGITVDVSTAMIDIDNGYDAFSLDNNRNTLADEPGTDNQRAHLASLKLTLATFNKFTTEVLLGYADSGSHYGYDEDWVYAGFHPWEYSSTDDLYRQHDNRSAELRLLSSDAGALLGGKTSWVTGLYSLQQQQDLERLYTFLPEPFVSNFSIDRLAWYGDTSTELSAAWSLDAGVRAERFESSYQDSNVLDFSPADTLFGGKLALNYHMASGNLLYTSISRGYKTGGFNTDGSLDADLREFSAEQLWNYETGFKGLALDGALQLQAALFTMARSKVQISSSTVRMRADGSSEFIDYIGNAAGGRNRGLELNARLQATGKVQIYGSLGLLDTAYEDFINSNGEDLDGRDQAHAPRHQFTLGTTWNLSDALTLDVNLQGRDDFYFSDSHDLRSKAYTLINASLGWTHDNWRATLWGRNLGDQDWFVRGYYFGNDPRDDYTPRGYTQLGEPLRYGLTLNLDF
jgi:iron complex outermembrane receptor protein